MKAYDFVEMRVKGWFVSGRVDLSDVVKGLHNACVHGKCIPVNNINDLDLESLFLHIDALQEVVERIET